MKSVVRLALLATTALPAAPALAAIDTGEARVATTSVTAEGVVAAHATQQDSSVGTGARDSSDDIIVTARRRQETAQEVPLAISVIGGEHIDNTGAFNVGRLQQLTPTLQFTSSNPRNTTLSIRGIGAPFGLSNDGFEQGVGIYVDDVYYSRAASSTFDFLDVQQIEVLRGPQGTLYGKNTTAGAINITSRQPTFDFEGRAEVTVGNLQFKQAKAAISGPLSEKFAARIALSSTSRRGTILNVKSGNWINEQDNLGLRVQLLFRPNDNLNITLSGDYSVQDPECCGTVFARVTSTQRAANRQYNALSAAANGGAGYTVVSRNPFARLTDIDAELNAGNKIGGTALRVKWEMGPGTLTSVTAWRFWDWHPANDRDFTGLPITTKSQNPSQQNQYTQELRYNYSSPRIDFVAGAFGYHQTVRTQGTEQLGSAASRWLLDPGTLAQAPVGSANCAPSGAGALACDPSVLNGVTAFNTIFLDNTSAALFGQVAWKVINGLTIQPGIRLNYDKKSGGYARRVFDGQGVQLFTTDASGNPITSASNPRVFAQIDQLTPQVFTVKDSAWNFSYDLNVSYRVTPDILVYGTYAKTFKSFGINLNGVPNLANGQPALNVAKIKPESVNHFEIGIKSTFWNGKAVLNLAAYRTDIGDFQVLVNSGAVSTTRGYLANARKVRTQGVEAEFSLRPNERFHLYVNGAHTDARYVDFTGAPCPPGFSGGGSGTAAAPFGTPGNSPASCTLSGSPLAGTSRWSASFGAEYNVPVTLLDKDGEVYLGFDGNARTRFSSNPSPSAATDIAGYALSNFRAGFRTEHGIDVFGWVRNAFDRPYFELLQVAPGSTGLIAGQPGDPRTWGGTIKVQF
ncbi:MAG: TonB-dependent receptor [Novosphingobium sp.]